jgi:DNA processing protein
MNEKSNIQELCLNSKGYPELLATIAAPPKKLYLRGGIKELPLVAVVGTRKPTEYGRKLCYRICYDLASSGIGIVSGLAYGIDAIAHQAALDAHGYTIAVLGNAIDSIYPAGNQHIAANILESDGAIVSEYEPGANTQRFNFPARNRSMAVPGSVFNLRSAGPNNLLKSGAKPVTDATDVLAEFELRNPALTRKAPKPASATEARIIELVEDGTNTTEELLRQLGLTSPELAQTLSLMEITGKLRSLGAGQWVAR